MTESLFLNVKKIPVLLIPSMAGVFFSSSHEGKVKDCLQLTVNESSGNQYTIVM